MDSDHSFGGSPRTSAPRPGVRIAVGTHTPEKPFHLDIIGKELSRYYRMPIIAVPVKILEPHPAPDEKGRSAEENANIKFRELLAFARTLKDEKSSAHKAAVQVCHQNGFDF